MKTISTTIALLMLGLNAQARLGEPVEACIKLYGKPTAKDEKTSTYQFTHKDREITAVFDAGKCAKITFHRAKEDFDDEEMDLLLQDNGGGHMWKISKSEGNKDLWVSKDGKRQCTHDTAACLVVIATDEWIAKEEADKGKPKAH